MIKLQSTNDIIVVDDDDFDLMMTKRYVEMSELVNPLLTFNSGESFISHMQGVGEGKSEMPALVFLDINMPRMDGFEVLEKIRVVDSFQALPIVMFLTTSQNPGDMARCQSFNAHIQEKFYSAEEAVQFLNNLIPDS